MTGYARARVVAAAQAILEQGAACVFEVCLDVPAQRWEARSLLLSRSAEAVADAVHGEIAIEPHRDARLAGCDRRTLAPAADVEPRLAYVTDTLGGVTDPSAAGTSRPVPKPAAAPPTRRPPMLVGDRMSPVVVTAGPEHTLHEVARRMTAHGVGAAVVLDDTLGRPGIITDRDVRHSHAVGQDIDAELVRSHVLSEVAYTVAGWPLEQAALAMVRGGFRHMIVLSGPGVVGILSMRDVLRCGTGAGATSGVPAGATS
jgi:CBS domain-containing protein